MGHIANGSPLRPEMRLIKLCVPIYFDDSVYPSAGDSAKRKLIYWRSIAVLCASVRRATNPRLDILICTNETPPSDISNLLAGFNVSFVSPDFAFRPPRGLYPAFSGAFYLFDCMNYCLRHFSDECIFVFLDPDCLVMDNLESVLGCARPIIGYELKLAEDEEENGCSRNDLLAFLGDMAGNEVGQPPRYFGGELLIVNGEELGTVCNIVEQVWTLNLTNFVAGKTTLRTEEHVISVALARLGDRVGLGNEIIKRMWTRPSFRNVSCSDEKFSIWHLPAEKQHAFQRLFALLRNDSAHLTNISEKEFRGLVSNMVGLNLSFMERPLYFLYPLIKRSAKRLAQLGLIRGS